jgi:hypothetical protein
MNGTLVIIYLKNIMKKCKLLRPIINVTKVKELAIMNTMQVRIKKDKVSGR